jgi:peptidoglycan/xylan/chitin deacetylase (PgdA/CDA1 family)
MIFRTPFVLPLLYPQLVWRIMTEEKKIYLTFDDGPIPGQTEFVLDTLNKFNAKATFFSIGDNVRKHPGVFNKVVTAGHSIGNHTFNHLKGWNCTTEEYINNIELCSSQFLVNGIQPIVNPLFRPPYGRIKRNQIKALKNYRIIMWDVLTYDYTTSCSPERSLKGSIPATRAGSIVVFHDSNKAERNLRYVLPRYLQHFSEKGFAFESL